MFNIEDFQDNSTLKPIILKLNKFHEKNKIPKIIKLVEELEELLDEQDNIVPVTYVLSVLAENNIKLISDSLLQKIELFLQSENNKLKINTIIIIGFEMLSDSGYRDKYFLKFLKLMIDKSEDIRDNSHFFVGELVKKKPDLICSQINLIFKSLEIEKKSDNIVSLLDFLIHCEDLNFENLYYFRFLSKSLITAGFHEKFPDIRKNLSILLKKHFPSLKEINLEENHRFGDVVSLLDNQFLMKRYNITELSKKTMITLKDFTEKIKRSKFLDKEIYFYIKQRKKNVILFFELEKEKLLEFFERREKISSEEILTTFSQIINNESESKLFIETLINLEIIHGYVSKLGYFYPIIFIKSKMLNDFQKKGLINMNNYDFLPPNFIKQIISEFSNTTKLPVLVGKGKRIYYSLKKIQEQVNSEAAKSSTIDLNAYRERLTEEDFIILIKNLPQEYLTNFRKGTQWLTNIGKTKIKNEIDNSKIIGFFDSSKISERLNIKQMLLMDVLELYIDLRSGIWNITKEIFYYSKFLKTKIDEINQILDEAERTRKINIMANDLNIDKNIILTKIDENLRLIGEEIKTQDQIKVNEYREKLGMDIKGFMNFINELDLNYFIKGDLLILNLEKIDDAKKSIRSLLIEKSKSEDYIPFGNFSVKATVIEDLIKELNSDEKIKGIFYKDGDEVVFYTEKGIQNLMMESSMLFSFHDLFYGKDLSEDEIQVMRGLFDDLTKSRNLKGNFEEETLTFSSEEIIFAKDYNIVVDNFGRMVNGYIIKFDKESQAMRKTLLKRKEIIYPQEIKKIQEVIDRINMYYVKWRAHIDSFINTANKKLLKEQGYSFQRYQGLAEKKKAEIKLFKEDPDVYEIVEKFNSWVSFFNMLELNYGKLIFLQKKLINNPDDEETNLKFNELLGELNLI